MSKLNGNSNTNGHNGKRRRYSDKERATILAALAANEGNVNRTSKTTGIPRKTVELWAKEQAGGNQLPDVATECHEKKRELADMCEQLARKLCGVMLEDERIKAARYGELNSGFGTATDKMRLLREQPTAISGTLTPEHLNGALERLNSELASKYGNDIPPITAAELQQRVQDYGDEVKG